MVNGLPNGSNGDILYQKISTLHMMTQAKIVPKKQNGPVWFLAGTYGHAVNRKCDIPAGKAILFPILNSDCSFAEFPKLKTLSELRVCAKTIQDQVTTLNATVESSYIQSTKISYSVTTFQFYFTSK